jgi:hypothetical protein
MIGPEGIADMKKITISRIVKEFQSPTTFNLTDRLTVLNTGNSLLTSHLYIPSVCRFTMWTVL